MMTAITTIDGRLTANPDLRFIPSGDARVSFTVAYSKRKFDKATNTWSNDGDPIFLDVVAWKQLAEGAADQLERGSTVIVTGELQQRNWEKDGQKRSKIELVAKEIGLSVRSRKPQNSAQEPEQQVAW